MDVLVRSCTDCPWSYRMGIRSYGSLDRWHACSYWIRNDWFPSKDYSAYRRRRYYRVVIRLIRYLGLIVLLFFTSAGPIQGLIPLKAEAAQPPVEVVNIDALARATAAQFAIDEVHFDDTMECESSGITTAVGDHGLAYGPFQWHQTSFNWLKSVAIKKGEPFKDLQYKDPNDQITLAAWAFANGYADQWSCYKQLSSRNWYWPARLSNIE